MTGSDETAARGGLVVDDARYGGKVEEKIAEYRATQQRRVTTNTTQKQNMSYLNIRHL